MSEITLEKDDDLRLIILGLKKFRDYYFSGIVGMVKMKKGDDDGIRELAMINEIIEDIGCCTNLIVRLNNQKIKNNNKNKQED